MKPEGGLRGVPMRHATNALIYNEALFEERRVALPRPSRSSTPPRAS